MLSKPGPYQTRLLNSALLTGPDASTSIYHLLKSNTLVLPVPLAETPLFLPKWLKSDPYMRCWLTGYLGC